MVHISVARNWNLVLKDALYDSTPTFLSSLNSSAKGCKYTSIAIPGEIGITSDKIVGKFRPRLIELTSCKPKLLIRFIMNKPC